MYEKITQGTDGLLALRITGTLSKREMGEITGDMDRIIAEGRKVRLFLIMEPYPDITIGADALYENLKFAKTYSDRIERMALVSRKVAEKTYMAIFGLFGGMVVEHFDLSEMDEAWKWIRA